VSLLRWWWKTLGEWTFGQAATFFFFYTPAGWLLMALYGILLWLTLPIWLTLLVLVLALERRW
jgi:hypothetical protein